MSEDWIPLCKRDKLPFGLIMAITASTLALTLLWTVVFTLFNPLADKLSLAQGIRTVVFLIRSLVQFQMK